MIKIIEAIYEMLGPEVTKSADDSPRKRAKMIFEKMDVNNDKELTLKEFVDGCLADKVRVLNGYHIIVICFRNSSKS